MASDWHKIHLRESALKVGMGFLLGSMLLGPGCQKAPEPPYGQLHLGIRHCAGSDSLVLESRWYTNAAGNKIRFSRVKYFLSGWRLYRDGKVCYQQKKPQLINAAYPSENLVILKDIPPSTYDSLVFHLGVVPSLNQQGRLDLPPYDRGMYWPEELGGGYHFLRLEGHWRHDSTYGTFAFHMGGHSNLITTTVPVLIKIRGQNESFLGLSMNMLGWFDKPYQWDLRQYPGYTMGIDSLMGKLRENGRSVWQVDQNP